jgi:hypothetical protein
MAQMTSRKMRDCRAGAAGPRSCGTRIYPAYRASPAGRRYDDPLYFSAVPQEGFETRPTHYKAWNRSVSAVHHFLLPCAERCHRHRKCPLSVRRDDRGYIVGCSCRRSIAVRLGSSQFSGVHQPMSPEAHPPAYDVLAWPAPPCVAPISGPAALALVVAAGARACAPEPRPAKAEMLRSCRGRPAGSPGV